MAESTTVLEQSSEPDKYFKGKQWYSAKRGEWIDPSQEIRTDAMKPQPDSQSEPSPSEQPEILNETEQFIEKLEAVERERKESEVEEVKEVEKVEEEEVKEVEEVEEEVKEVEERVEAVEEMEEVKEVDERMEKGKEGDTQSVVAAVEIIVQRPSLPSEPSEIVESEASEKSEGAVFEIVDHQVDTEEDTKEETEGETEVELKPVDDDTISIFAGVDADSTVIEGGGVASEFTLYRRDEDIKGNYHVVEQGVIVSKRNEDNISVLSFSVTEDGDNATLRSVTIEKDVSAAEHDDEEEEEDDDDDADSVKTLKEAEDGKRERVDVTEGVVYTEDNIDIEVHPDDADDEVEVDQYKSERKTDEDGVSVRSYSVHGDYILSLHQRVQPPPAPQPRASQTLNNSANTETAEAQPEITEALVSNLEENLSYEDHRSRINFEAVVKASMEEHKAERKKTDIEVLEDIQREEGEDTPNIAMLLAWAKSTRNKNTTQTFVVKKKKREEVLRQSVNTNSENFEVIIQEKVSQKVEEKESTAGKPSFMVKKKKDVSASTVVSKGWLENAINHHEGVNNSSVTKMDFSETKQGLHRATIEAQVNGENKTYNWTIKAKEQHQDKEAFITSDLGPRLARFVAASGRSKQPLSVPAALSVYSDGQHSVLPDTQGYRPGLDRQLDENHLKVAVRALARLHAISFAYFSRSSDNNDLSTVLKFLVDQSYQATASISEKEKTRKELELEFSSVLDLLEESSADNRLLTKTKALSSSLYNIYKEAKQSSSKHSVLCHGRPTANNIIFLYNEENFPVEAKFINFSHSCIGSPLSDLLVLMNTAGEQTGREDWFLKFVYHETMVKTIKLLGVQSDIIDFDELKKEKAKQSLYGYIESAILLNTGAEKQTQTNTKRQTVISNGGQSQIVQSKILGNFVPRNSTNMQVAANTNNTMENGSSDTTERILDLLERATAAVNVTNKF